MLAYDVQESQISGGPSWVTTDKRDIVAKRDDGLQHSVEETRSMLQDMLEERFTLRVHRETERRSAYVLTVTKSGPKFAARAQTGGTNLRITSNSINLESGELAQMTKLTIDGCGSACH